MRFPPIPFACLLLLLNSCSNDENEMLQFNEIFPPQKIHTAALFRINGLNLSAHFFQGQKTAVKLVDSQCNKSCTSVLNQFDDAPHQSLLFFTNPEVASEHLGDLANTFKNVAITVGSTARSTDFFASSFEISSESGIDQTKVIYLVNQQGEVAGWVEDHAYSASLLAELN